MASIKKEMGTGPPGETLVVALDFGTTFSGVSYAFSTDKETIYTIKNWPGAEDKIVPKAPTVIQYEIDSKTSFKWGYDVDPLADNKITNLKLLLDPDQPRPYLVPTHVEDEMAKLPKSPVEVISDYIGAMFKHAIVEIDSESLDPTFLDNFEKRFVLTVPAVWSDKAKNMTLEAAKRAGISHVEMITEPEAAALLTLDTAKSKGLKVGDAVVICDAGGGTVDLVAYEIVSINPLKLRALSAPSGGICGSVMVNKLFEEEVRKVVKDGPYRKLRKSPAYQSALAEFDVHLKPGFRGRDDKNKFVSFPMAGLRSNKAAGLVSNSMTLSGTTMARIFDPIIQEIQTLVSDQMKSVKCEKLKEGKPQVIKAIFLVGGFGSSAYLKSAIEKANPGVLVIQPKEAWSAIMKGAVMSALFPVPTVVSTRARKHYGTDGNTPWDALRDAGQEKIWDRWGEIWRCNTMTWYIHKDDELVRDKKIKLPFCTSWPGSTPPKGPSLILKNTLLESDAPIAPAHPTTTTVNCVLTTNLSTVPAKCFIRKYRASDDAPYVRLSYNLLVENNQSGLMKFSLEVEGKEYGSVDTTY
ncbi:hypothetical protein QBC39DRAFT_372068 [Podospora conica]|nr:hypothetical protein QBC39DRAFT_372068 [Schizothecium conicum]